MIGANSRMECGSQRQAAERRAPRRFSLARRGAARRIDRAKGAQKRTSDANHLFRTPSLIGQVCAFRSNLPVFLGCADDWRPGRQHFADTSRKNTFVLWNLQGGSWVMLSSIDKEKGPKPCVSSNLLPFSVSWPRCRLVVTRWANRRFMAQVQVQQPRPFWMATSWEVLPLARQAMRFIARATPASADKSGLTALFKTDSIAEAAFGQRSGCGFLPSNILQPKDDPCSTRS